MIESALVQEMTGNVKTELTHAHAMKACGGVEVQLHSFLTSVLDGVSS
jgi:hypothetical protein